MPALGLGKSAPVQFDIRPEASPGERKVTEELSKWAIAHQADVLSQAAEALNVTKAELSLSFKFDWSRLPPQVQEQAERAAKGSLPLSLRPEGNPRGEVEFVVRTKDGANEFAVWEGSITGLSVSHPALFPAQVGVIQADTSYGAVRRLNQWCGKNLDDAPRGLFSLGEQKIPIFTAIVSIPFAAYYWTKEEMNAGFRISDEFDFAVDAEGKPCISLARTNSTLEPIFCPNLDKRRIENVKKYLLVEVLTPQRASTDSPDWYESFIDTVFKACNRGKAPSELRAEMRQFGVSAMLEMPDVLASEQLQKLGLQSPDAFKTESRKHSGLVGREKAKIEGTKELRAFMQSLGDDSSLDETVKSEARGLVMPIISATQHGQKADPVKFDRIAVLLPASYQAEIERLKASLT